MKGAGGRRASFEKTTAQKVVEYLLKHDGATHKELMERADTPSEISHRVLDNALKSLIDVGIIGVRADDPKGKRAILYVIKEPLLFTKIPGAHSSLLSWIERVIDHIEGEQESEPGTGIEIDKLTPEEIQSRLYDQDLGVTVAVRWLGVIILDAMVEANGKHNEEERRKYLDKFCCTYLNVLISDLVYLASDACGNSERAYAVGLEALDANHLSSYMSGEWPPLDDPDEKRGSKPA